MFPSTKRNGLSFMVAVYLALALASAGLVSASGHEQMQDVHRRVGQNRMLKKRQIPSLFETGTDTSTTGTTTPTPATTSVSTTLSATSVTTTSAVTTTKADTSTTNTAVTTTGVSTATSLTVTTSSALSTSSTVSLPVSSVVSSSSSSSPSSSSTTPSTTSTSTHTTATPTTTVAPEVADAPTTTSAPHTVRTSVTRTITSEEPSSTASASSTSAVSKTTKTTLTVIAAIAGSVGGAFLLWTIIRKWKFRPSAEFEDRMQPIDWQPTDSNDTGLPAHRRANSGASSFHSGTGPGQEDNLAGRGMAAYGATSDHGHAAPALAPIPDHDFTAPAVQPGLAPVGGYADLARGPSPQPQMQEMGRGYDNYAAAPAHYQGYNQQEAYYNNGQRY